jgi:hypothetical protein
MIEHSEGNNYPLLDSISTKREQLALEKIDIDLLKAQAGSHDPQLSNVSQRVLRSKWNLESDRDTINAESRDINDQLKDFSSDELNVIFKNLVGLQLTEGCNGACPFCLFGPKSGVTAKYSFESLETLFHDKSDLLSENPFLLYWNSDPFDYRDGDKSFVDVYKLYRQTLPNNSQYISTAIPRGSEGDFIKFMLYFAQEQERNDGKNKRIIPVRMSLTQQNIQRIESTISELTKQLLANGYGQSDINTFFSRVLSTVGRFDNFLLPLGPNIKNADDIKNTFSIACRDGVVIAPDSCQAIMMTAATTYEPSGQASIALIPGQAKSQVPIKIREEHYAKFTIGLKPLSLRTKLRQTMLPIIKNVYGEEYSLSNKYADANLKLGREAASINRLISNFSRIGDLILDPPILQNEKNTFMTVSVEVFRDRQQYTQNLINSIEQYNENASLSDEEFNQIKYNILLSKIQLSKMDFLASQVEQGKSFSVVSRMALILSEIGRNDLEKIPVILKALSEQQEDELIELNIQNKADIRSFIDSIH